MSANDLTIRLNEAIALIKAGQTAQGRAILLLLVQQYPTSDALWLWLATTSTDPAERIAALRQVLAINPYNEKARTALTQLTGETLPPPLPVPVATPEIVIPTASAAPSQPAKPLITAKQIEQGLIVAAGILAVILGVLFTGDVVMPRLFPSATPTASNTPRPTITPTPTVPTPTNTATYTPGGPTLTPPGPTLPPTWTPRPAVSVTPRLTATPRDTLPPPPSTTPRPTLEPTLTTTPFPTKTPFPTDTPQP
jgi:hypothetical protein